MTKQECIGTSYQPIGGGYAYSALRVGLVVRNPAGRKFIAKRAMMKIQCATISRRSMKYHSIRMIRNVG